MPELPLAERCGGCRRNAEGLAGSSVPLTTSRTVTADEAYLIEKIRNPNATTVKG
jgi:hypothetical protein